VNLGGGNSTVTFVLKGRICDFTACVGEPLAVHLACKTSEVLRKLCARLSPTLMLAITMLQFCLKTEGLVPKKFETIGDRFKAVHITLISAGVTDFAQARGVSFSVWQSWFSTC